MLPPAAPGNPHSKLRSSHDLSGNSTDAAIDLRGATADMTINRNAVLAGSPFQKFGVAEGRTLTVNGDVTGGKRLDLTGDQAGDPSGATGSVGTTATITPSGPVENIVAAKIAITSGPAAGLFGRLVATRH